ncbi:MAG TPA: hybrid sensor histidine kinase/response regulator [Verrucomicrobia bacterium]|nr:hybrid sensor histidine kinase/response regulator [Verrucomicrobiota bacterium]HOP96037.1 hybrid sensor histidine kinase/response regulator [Verrucomicrobiota bacterium]
MESVYDYKKYGVLYVDDEEKSLKYFSRAFEEQFRIFTASNAQDGLKLLEEHSREIGVLMTDQRMPGEKGVWLLEKARQNHPRIIRILATAYADMDAAIAAVNTGAIYKYVTKPWDPVQLEQTLKRSLEFFMVQQERDQLLREKMSVLHNMMIADRIVSLGLLAAGLSHHIRNSLVAVKTFLDLAPAKMAEEKLEMSGLRNPDFWKEYYQNVQNQIEKINSLLKDLWVASEKPAFEFADEVNVRDVVASSIDMLRSGFAAKKIEVQNDVSESLPVLKVDKPKFYRLFDLLLRDELASLPAGSRITISARELNGSLDRRAVQIQVSDNGPGLPQEALRLVFDPFVVRADSPMEYGIHLMACYFIVHHHGGRIEARSENGRGTVFTIRLPLDPNEVPSGTTDTEFLRKVLLNDSLWEKLIRSD